MSNVWQQHSETERDWLDDFEDRELSRFGAFRGIVSVGKLYAGLAVGYYALKGLLWLGLAIYRWHK